MFETLVFFPFFNVSGIFIAIVERTDSYANSAQFLMLETLMFEPLQR